MAGNAGHGATLVSETERWSKVAKMSVPSFLSFATQSGYGGHGRTWPDLLFARPCREMAHHVISLPSIDALRKAYSISSSAVICMIMGTVRRSAFAVLRLITSSILVGWITGKSDGLAPLRTLPT